MGRGRVGASAALSPLPIWWRVTRCLPWTANSSSDPVTLSLVLLLNLTWREFRLPSRSRLGTPRLSAPRPHTSPSR